MKIFPYFHICFLFIPHFPTRALAHMFRSPRLVAPYPSQWSFVWKLRGQELFTEDLAKEYAKKEGRLHPAKPCEAVSFFRFFGYMASRLGNSTIIKMSPRQFCKCGLCFKPSTVRIPTNLRDNPLLRTQTWNRAAFGSCIFVYLRVSWQLRCSLYLRCEGE